MHAIFARSLQDISAGSSRYFYIAHQFLFRLNILLSVFLFIILLSVFYPSVSVGRLVHRYIIYNSPSGMDWSRCISIPSHNLFCLYFKCFYWMSFLSLREFSCFLTVERIVRAETSARMFSNVTQIQLICLIYSLISRSFALQKALLIMRVSGQSLLASVRVLIFIFTSDLHSKLSANMFHIPWLFLHYWFWCVWSC